MSADIRLFHCRDARSFRALWALEELELPYALELMRFPPRVFVEGYRDVNPLGTVPALIVDGQLMLNPFAYSSSMFYVIAYVMMTTGAFGMILLMSRAGFEADNIDDFKGLNKRSPWFAGVMLMLMFMSWIAWRSLRDPTLAPDTGRRVGWQA